MRIIALGASNLTRGFQVVVDTSRATWGPDVEVIGALGHGRSYGAESWFLGRTLPGILQSGLWSCLETLRAAPTRALVTDVGNDILYGFPAAQILSWLTETVDRLRRITSDIVVAGLPMSSIRTISERKFLLFRTIVAPRCRLPLCDVRSTAEQVSDGLRTLAEGRGLRFTPLEPAWYGFDPIHVRPRAWRAAWHRLMGPGVVPIAGGAGTAAEWLRLYMMKPEQQALFGRRQSTPQSGVRLPGGGRVWLF